MPRGMNMGEMSRRRQRQKRERAANVGGRPQLVSERERPDDIDDTEDESIDLASDDTLEDRGDGVRVLSRARRQSEESLRDACPDEPPPGWCETD